MVEVTSGPSVGKLIQVPKIALEEVVASKEVANTQILPELTSEEIVRAQI